MNIFLDRLMLAESGGSDLASNPRSTALGPYQFIETTFIEIVHRHFAKEVGSLDRTRILKLRTNRAFARKAAQALTREHAEQLAAAGLKPTFPSLRLAFLLGAGGAIAILKANPTRRLTRLLPSSVIKANPFMAGLTARGIINRAAGDISSDPSVVVGIKPRGLLSRQRRGERSRISIQCNLGLASCRRWVALQKRKLNARDQFSRP